MTMRMNQISLASNHAHPPRRGKKTAPARPATLRRIETAVRDHPLRTRTPRGVEKAPRLPRPGRSGRRGARGGERRDHRASSAAAEGRVGQPPSKERTAPPRKPRPLLGPAPTGGKAPSSSSAASAHGHPAPCGAARSEDLRLEAARVCAAQKLQRYSVTAELHDRRRKRSAARSAG
ncbi:unnamed protein product [Prorocentrum cordatum]|uniref:Uncharacterized protein n=1 Tax=Prorocentrum cordatum TaxID=2364126 RepID=A0ABN9QKI9_9DINO|nr:unnamed protein product [Polarella glacialis]